MLKTVTVDKKKSYILRQTDGSKHKEKYWIKFRALNFSSIAREDRNPVLLYAEHLQSTVNSNMLTQKKLDGFIGEILFWGGGMPMACRSSQARNGTCARAVTMSDP